MKLSIRSFCSPYNVHECAIDRARVARIVCYIIYIFAHPRSPTFLREALNGRPIGPVTQE